MDFFFGHAFKSISLYVPDVAALRAGSAPVVVGVGRDSTGQLANRCGFALAEKLGADPVVFPGDHGDFGDYGDYGDTFAATLHEVFSAA